MRSKKVFQMHGFIFICYDLRQNDVLQFYTFIKFIHVLIESSLRKERKKNKQCVLHSHNHLNTMIHIMMSVLLKLLNS